MPSVVRGRVRGCARGELDGLGVGGVVGMMEALKAARGVLEREMAVRIDCFTLGGRIETTDDEGRALIAECADGMKAIDAVLADGWQPIATAPGHGVVLLGMGAPNVRALRESGLGLFVVPHA